jgi:hypothetical protein
MKYKLKYINGDLLEYSLISNSTINNNCKLIDVKYQNDSLEFQTPKVLIEKIINENDKHYLLLKLIPTQACRTFFNKILELEHSIEKNKNAKWFNNELEIIPLTSIFTDVFFKVKIPFKYSKPQINIFSNSNGKLFNYYSLREGMEIICLLSINKLWINFDNTINYNLIANEIIIID